MKLVTPFYLKHLNANATLIDVFGWQLASVYKTIEDEYKLVREKAGFIDYSFQSAIAVVGKDAIEFLQKIIVNDLDKIKPGKAIYSSILDESGKIIDDTIIFYLSDNHFIINGGFNKYNTLKWLNKHSINYDVWITEKNTCFLALQGPESRNILNKELDINELQYFNFKETSLGDIPILLARCGFSGEIGYELYINPEYAHELWDTLIELGKEHNVGPYGMGVSAILSVEKGYLTGSDFYEGSTPLELGLEWTVRFDKGDFIGKEALLKRKSEGIKNKLMGFEVLDPNVCASPKDKLFKNNKIVGEVTYKGIYGPSINKSIGRGWVDIEYANINEMLDIEHEGKKTKIKIVNYRWYDPNNKILKS